jgi:sulfate adenylyltransferase subunit 2
MMDKALSIIKQVANAVNRVILFHSASGKDSIALLDLMSFHFKEVVCVYMYITKELFHINRYINYACRKYPNIKYVQIPHFALYSYRRIGYMGCMKNEKQKLYNMAQLTDIVKERYNIEWAFFGFKQSDSMNRRLMLRTYDMNGINEAQKKCYPLSEYKNKDVLEYISRNGLIKPETYGSKHQSFGTDITDINYLLFLREKFPEDLRKVVKEYPLVERKLFEYDYERNKAE